MEDIITRTTGAYTIGFTAPRLDSQIGDIIEFIQLPQAETNTVLGGRQQVNIYTLPCSKTVVVKQYTRGGLIRLLGKDKYIRLGKTRSQMEFEWLERVRGLGVSSPEPIAFVAEGRLFYRCWLITEEIKNHQSFAHLSFKSETHAASAMNSLISQVAILIDHHILHVDLHPGNVLIDNANRIYLIDFDKACIYSGSKAKLARRYIARWRRAVVKHHLPPLLSQAFKEGLLELRS